MGKGDEEEQRPWPSGVIPMAPGTWTAKSVSMPFFVISINKLFNKHEHLLYAGPCVYTAVSEYKGDKATILPSRVQHTVGASFVLGD